MKEIKYIERKTGEIIIEKPPGESFLKFLYHKPIGRISLELMVKRKFLTNFYGWLMHQRNSKKKIQSFVDEYAIDMSESEISVDDFCSFNDFFIRKLKPDARIISDAFVSPADGKILAFKTIDEICRFYVKGRKFSLVEYLKNKQLADKYENGVLLIIRLAPNDYHRFHFPYSGTPTESTKIKGFYYSVSPYSTLVNFSKVFCENKRTYTTLVTHDKGDILLSPVGATMVGSITDTFEANSAVEKGDEMGYFSFGGSSILVLIEKGKIKIDEDILENTRNGIETRVLMGERIGI